MSCRFLQKHSETCVVWMDNTRDEKVIMQICIVEDENNSERFSFKLQRTKLALTQARPCHVQAAIALKAFEHYFALEQR